MRVHGAKYLYSIDILLRCSDAGSTRLVSPMCHDARCIRRLLHDSIVKVIERCGKMRARIHPISNSSGFSHLALWDPDTS